MIFRRLTILFSIVSCSCAVVCAQSVNDVKKQKEKAEKEITYLNKLLNEAAKDKSVSTGKLNILQEKIAQSKNLLNSLNQEVRYLQSDKLAKWANTHKQGAEAIEVITALAEFERRLVRFASGKIDEDNAEQSQCS